MQVTNDSRDYVLEFLLTMFAAITNRLIVTLRYVFRYSWVGFGYLATALVTLAAVVTTLSEKSHTAMLTMESQALLEPPTVAQLEATPEIRVVEIETEVIPPVVESLALEAKPVEEKPKRQRKKTEPREVVFPSEELPLAKMTNEQLRALAPVYSVSLRDIDPETGRTIIIRKAQLFERLKAAILEKGDLSAEYYSKHPDLDTDLERRLRAEAHGYKPVDFEL